MSGLDGNVKAMPAAAGWPKGVERCEEDRARLYDHLAPLIKDTFQDAIHILEELLPGGKSGEDAENARLFKIYKTRVLNTGNRQLRVLPKVLGCFATTEVIRREMVEQVVIPGEGIHNLPPGVKIRTTATEGE